MAARLVGPTGRVVAFEPSPRNLGFLHHHLALNHSANVQVLNVAVSDSEGETRFLVNGDPRLSKITNVGDIIVRMTTLDHLISKLPLPDLIEMDIEGAEYSALLGAERVLRKSNPVIFLSTHERKVHRACCDLLSRLGYKLHSIGAMSIDEADELCCVPT
jgi:FkbM family methyltransferase